jgi:hypothetical protein
MKTNESILGGVQSNLNFPNELTINQTTIYEQARI